MDLIQQTIESSKLKFNPRLTRACLHIIAHIKEKPLPPGVSRCRVLMHTLYKLQQCFPMNLPYYWYKDGVVVDPTSLTQQTHGIIQFIWDDDCRGCQIETECTCTGNPHKKGDFE